MTDEQDLEEDVELGEEVEARVKRTGTALVAVRVPRDLLARINEYGQLRQITVSEVLRVGAERLVGGTPRLRHVSGAPFYGQGVSTEPSAQGGSLRSYRETSARSASVSSR